MPLDRSKPIWILGIGAFGRAVSNALADEDFNVEGFVQTTPTSTEIDGRPVFSLDRVPARAQLVLGIFNRDTPYDEILGTCAAAGVENVLMPWEVYPLISQHLGWRYWLSDPRYIHAHKQRTSLVETIWADEESRETYRRILQFRAGEDVGYSSFRHADEQYFNSITLAEHTRNRGCYVDCGAYDGDTYLRYLQKVGEPSRAILLEPDRSNFRQLVARTAAMKSDVICLPLAVSDNLVSLRFTETSGEASSVGDHGTVVVQAIALDQLMASQRVGFLKLDVEGAEKAALHGAKTILARDRPVVTMSLYHRPEDMWELPEILHEYCKNYSFYLRQHYFNSFDSVLYAIPWLC